MQAEDCRNVSEGNGNFAMHLNDYTLVYAIREYVLREGEGFSITDAVGVSVPG